MEMLIAPDPQFASDNYSGAHPAILQAFINAAQGSALSYGNDNYTKQAEELFSKIFQRDCAVFFVTTGTASNVIALASVMTQFQAVICTDSLLKMLTAWHNSLLSKRCKFLVLNFCIQCRQMRSL